MTNYDFNPEKCKSCIRAPIHISNCTSRDNTCIRFPYDMGNNNKDLYEPKNKVQ